MNPRAPIQIPARLAARLGVGAGDGLTPAQRGARLLAAIPTRRGPRATAAVSRLASELGVDLADVRGTGAGGRITTGDVRAATPRVPAAASPALSPERRAAIATNNRDQPADTKVRDLANSLAVDLRDVYAAGVSGPAGMPSEADVRAHAARNGLTLAPAGAQEDPRDSVAYRAWSRCFTKGGGLA